MEIILKPFSWLLLFFYHFAGYGVALILFGFLIKLILFPVTLKGKKSMIQMNMVSSKMQQLQAQYGKDRVRYNEEVQKLYAKEKVNPMGGCVWSMVPMIFLLALYGVIRQPLRYLMDVPKNMTDLVATATGIANTGAYPQIAMAKALNDPTVLANAKAALGNAGDKLFGMNFSFLGLDLAAIPNFKFWVNGLSWGTIGLFALVLVSASVSFLSMRVSMATNKMNNQSGNQQMDKTNRSMMLMMPLMSLWIGFTVPAGLSIYWIAQYVVTMLQEVICGRILKKDYEAIRMAAQERETQAKDDEKHRKEEARLERARRLEEEKLNKKNKQKTDELDQQGINKDDSREGIRAYARGRAYVPNRYGDPFPYVDPNDLFKEQVDALNAAREEKKAAKKRKKSAATVEKTEEAPKQELEAPVQTEAEGFAESLNQTEAPATDAPIVETPATEEAAPETEEVEVEVEEIEVELPEDHKEGN